MVKTSNSLVENMKNEAENPYLEGYIIEAVKNQLRGNDPPIVKKTYNRLIKEGHSKDKARRLIGYALMVEMNDMLKTMRVFDLEKYTHSLNRLPDIDLDED